MTEKELAHYEELARVTETLGDESTKFLGHIIIKLVEEVRQKKELTCLLKAVSDG
jgi:hypothetical protein